MTPEQLRVARIPLAARPSLSQVSVRAVFVWFCCVCVCHVWTRTRHQSCAGMLAVAGARIRSRAGQHANT